MTRQVSLASRVALLESQLRMLITDIINEGLLPDGYDIGQEEE